MFGWIVGGQTSNPTASSPCMKITSADASTDEILQRFWLQEELLNEPILHQEDQQVLEKFQNTTTRDLQGRFSVSLLLFFLWENPGTSCSNSISRINGRKVKGISGKHSTWA